jgi:GTPase SAR1 family protein
MSHGGFVGREKEIQEIKKLLLSDLYRIVTITGAGGVGKTAIAQKIALDFYNECDHPFEGIIWFSAKDRKLSDTGIHDIEPSIKNINQLIKDILELIDEDGFEKFELGNSPEETYINYVLSYFENNNYLVIIDNLETILGNEPLIDFISKIPTKVLITSRKGLGRLDQPYALKDMNVENAVKLFIHIAESKDLTQLLSINKNKIIELVKRVKCYPLAIKWALGQHALGKPLENSFFSIIDGESDIAKFSFEKIFNELHENSKLCLYSIIILDEPASFEILQYLTDFSDNQLNDAINELTTTSFIHFTELGTKYDVLSLTRGYIDKELEKNEQTRLILQDKKYKLSNLIEADTKLKSVKTSLPESIGIKTMEEKVAFNHVRKAKELFLMRKNYKGAEDLFEKAIKLDSLYFLS